MQYTQLSRRSAGVKSSDIDWEKQYLTFIPVVDTSFRWAQRATSGTLEYSTNEGQTWVTIANGESTPTITAGSKVIWRGNLKPNTTSSNGGIGSFSANDNYNAYGNTMSLLYYDNYYGSQLNSTAYNYAFRKLFYNDTYVLSAPILPATILATYCYNSMFQGCTSLTTAPELPATTLANSCYSVMFYGCTSLTTAPELPATTLANGCYYGMFEYCKSLVTSPELPATTLADSCYSYMFDGCTSLVTAPKVLPATTLAKSCYSGMFSGCKSLVTAPELPATTLAEECYGYMFYGCSSLNYIKALFTTTPSSDYTNQWVKRVASTGTFVKNRKATWTTTGVNGIPTGWTVVDDNS